MAVAIRNLTLGYDRRPAVHHLDLDVPKGSLTAVVGPNGAGKSTLLKALSGEIRPIEGSITLGVRRVAYLPQLYEVDRSFPTTVEGFVAMGLWHIIGAFSPIRRVERGLVAEAMATVGLTGFERRPISALSGGQMQRVMFARLLLQDADLILLESPSQRSTPAPLLIFFSSSSVGTATGALYSRCSMISIWCASTFPRPCCWPARGWRMARQLRS